MSGWFHATGAKYAPLDEILQLPAVRILRYLRRCDEVTSADVYVALEVSEYCVGVYNQALCRLVKEGRVTRRGPGRNYFMYSINDVGLAHLERLLRRSEILPPLSDREATHDHGLDRCEADNKLMETT